jgi:hypothetical protein
VNPSARKEKPPILVSKLHFNAVVIPPDPVIIKLMPLCARLKKSFQFSVKKGKCYREK